MTYLLTFSCYGTRLHGDESGSVDPRHNIPGHLRIDANVARVSSERHRMVQEPYEMDEPRRQSVLASIVEHCQHRNWRLLAAHVRTNHVHVTVDAPVAPEKVLNELKAYASRHLNQATWMAPIVAAGAVMEAHAICGSVMNWKLQLRMLPIVRVSQWPCT